jgi:hypothetical protein
MPAVDNEDGDEGRAGAVPINWLWDDHQCLCLRALEVGAGAAVSDVYGPSHRRARRAASAPSGAG